MRKLTIMMFVLAAVISLSYYAYYAYAATPGGAQITDNGENTYMPASAQSVDVNSGAIRNADLYAEMSTYRWAGLFGNVSGKIVLASGSGLSADKMFEWTANGSIVFATTASSVDWADLNRANETEILANFSYLASGSDNYNATFTYSGTLNTDTVIGGSITANYALTKDNASIDYWKTFALDDGTNIVFAGEVDPAGHNSYNSVLSQFQMILPEDGTNGDTTATAYNIWIELV